MPDSTSSVTIDLPPTSPSTIDAPAAAAGANDFVPPTGRYVVTEAHAIGGLGVVYKAAELDFGRTLAFKSIRPDRDTIDARARFDREAVLTARLQHPGIVPVHGRAATDDGRPAYVMRFIDGRTFQQAIRAFHRDRPEFHSPAFRQLLRQFVSVCQTIAFAHSRGVVHRDLKPANVMVGEYGETYVVDWGLAKEIFDGPVPTPDPNSEAGRSASPSASDSGDLTQEGWAMGTPAYMSPEQAFGRPDRIGPPSDVYSLGVILYEMLTGRSPERPDGSDSPPGFNPWASIAPAKAGRPRVPAALSAVAAKAMAYHPDDRYASADDLARDIENWLADEPVSAWREPAWVVALRTTRKRPRLVTALAAVVVMAGLGAALLSWQSERGRAALVHEQANTLAQLRQAVLARTQTRDALDLLVSDITGDALASQATPPTPKQRQLLHEVLKYYEKFAAEPGDDRLGRERLARATNDLGRIHDRLGHWDAAADVLGRAVRLYESLHADHPDVVEYAESLAACSNSLGTVLEVLERSADAEAAYRQALKLVENGTTSAGRKILAAVHVNLGRLFAIQGDLGPAEESLRAAVAVTEPLLAQFPDDPEYPLFLVACHNNLAILLENREQYEQAEVESRAGLAGVERLIAAHPNDPKYLTFQAATWTNLGNVLEKQGKLTEAGVVLMSAVRSMEMMAAAFPADPEYPIRLGGCYGNYGRLVGRTDPRSALDWYAKSLAVLNPIFEADPRHGVVRAYLLNTHGGRVEKLTMLQRDFESLPDFDRILELCPPDQKPEVRQYRARVLAKLRRFEEAAADVDRPAPVPPEDQLEFLWALAE